MPGNALRKDRRRGDAQAPRKGRRKRSIIAFEMIRLDRAAPEPLHEQLYQQIRQELATGSFGNGPGVSIVRTPGSDPGSRSVKLALERLRAEGYLY